MSNILIGNDYALSLRSSSKHPYLLLRKYLLMLTLLSLQQLLLTNTIESAIQVISVNLDATHYSVRDGETFNFKCSASISPSISQKLTLNSRIGVTFNPRQTPRSYLINGVVKCDEQLQTCVAHFEVDVNCIIKNVDYTKPSSTIEIACQFVDDYLCSGEWINDNRDYASNCFKLGQLTIYSKFEYGESCSSSNSSQDQLCASGMLCDSLSHQCLCMQNHIPMKDANTNMTKCVSSLESTINVPHTSSDQHHQFPTKSPSNISTNTNILPAGHPKVPENHVPNKSPSSSKSFWIFLVVITIILIITLVVIAIWSRASQAITATAS